MGGLDENLGEDEWVSYIRISRRYPGANSMTATDFVVGWFSCQVERDDMDGMIGPEAGGVRAAGQCRVLLMTNALSAHALDDPQ